MDISNSPCPICGQINYQFGFASAGKGMYFTPAFKIGGNPFKSVRTFFNTRVVIKTGRLCLTCGNVTIYVNPEDMPKSP